ncbi:MAG: M55 family metallopeptidase [Bryobacteraceae bacterium]
MKILIAADMEGITGVVHADQTDSTHAEYQRFRRLMTADVNAAIRGAFAGGADEVVVSDGHGSGRNILIEELDPRARLNTGAPRPLSMVEGLAEGVQAALFIGYHARAGTPDAILSHTWSGKVAGLRLNRRPFGETGLNAAVCGHFGVPVLMVSGDQAVCAEAVELLGPIETAIVKRAKGRMSAECLPPEASQRAIEEAARRAVARFLSGDGPQPLRLETPIALEIEWTEVQMAETASLLPGSRRTAARVVELTAADILEAYRAFRAAVLLATR